MNQECIQILKKIAAKQKDGDLLLYLKVLSRIINLKDLNSLDISSFYNIEDEEIVPELQEADGDKPSDGDENYRDLRLLNLRFQNFRTFPLASDGTKYGLRFERGGNPCSTFLVGRNSTGKSSIFSAIEYYYSHKLSHAELRYIAEHERFLHYGFDTSNEMRLSLATKVGNQEVAYQAGDPKDIYMPALFCSDNDIYSIGKYGTGDITPFVLEQLGYLDLSKIHGKLKEITEEMNKMIVEDQQTTDKQIPLDSDDLKEVLKVYMEGYYSKKELMLGLCNKFSTVNEKGIAVTIREEIRNPDFLKNDNRYLFKEDWDKLHTIAPWSHLEAMDAEKEKLKKDAETEREKLEKKLIQKHNKLNQLLQFEPARAIRLYEEWEKGIFDSSKGIDSDAKGVNINLLTVLNQVVAALDLEKQDILESFNQDYSKFIEESLKYFSEKYETFKLDYRNFSELKMSINVSKTGEKPFPTNPAEYLNSFRFKQYAIALKLSLALYYMKIKRCILPIVIDDVFNANDFDNSIHLQYFVHQIYELYHDKVSKKIPLQLIMFTHDEIILSAFQKGYNTKEIIKWNESQEDRAKSQQKINLYKDNCIIGRLHPYQKAEFIQKNKKDNKNNPDNSAPEFYNLYTEINYYGKIL